MVGQSEAWPRVNGVRCVASAFIRVHRRLLFLFVWLLAGSVAIYNRDKVTTVFGSVVQEIWLVERFRYWYTLLLAALVLLMIAAPISEAFDGGGPRHIATGFFVLMLIAAVPAVSHSRRAKNITVLLAVPAIVLHGLQELDWANPVFDSDGLAIAADLCSIVFLGYIIVMSLIHLFRARRVTTDSLSAAICIYLLLGVIWASVYSALDRIDPTAIAYPTVDTDEPIEPRLSSSSANATLYYSFVTMTTLGYGDIVPRSSIARTAAMLQALMGQLYLTVLVARMVALHIVHEREEK